MVTKVSFTSDAPTLQKQENKLLADFQDEHQELLHRYLNFFALKKDRCIKEVETAFEQVRDRHAKTQLFSKQDMENVLDDMEQEMRNTFKSELEIFYRMSGVFIQMIMYDAEKQKSIIHGDVNYMENYKALQDLKEFESLNLSQDFSLQRKQTKMAQLPALGTPMQVTIKEKIVEDEVTKQKNKQLEAELSEMKEKLANVKVQEEKQQTDSEPKANPLTAKIVESLQVKVAEMQGEMDKKLKESSAVASMKQIIKDKNAKINELREKLAKYEGDD